jgi:hypothetical protein
MGGVMQDAEHVVIEAESEDEVLRLKTPDLEAVARNAIAIRHPAANLWQGDMGPGSPNDRDERQVELALFLLNLLRTVHNTQVDQRPTTRCT